MVSGIISALIIGLIIGALGRLIVPGRQSIPIWLTMLIGIGAALLGAAITRGVGLAKDGFGWSVLIIQVILAAIGVSLVNGLYRRRRIT